MGEGRLAILLYPRGKGMPLYPRLPRKLQGQSGGGPRGRCGTRLHAIYAGTANQGEVRRLGLASSNNANMLRR